MNSESHQQDIMKLLRKINEMERTPEIKELRIMCGGLLRSFGIYKNEMMKKDLIAIEFAYQQGRERERGVPDPSDSD